MNRKSVWISMDLGRDNRNPNCILNALVYPRNAELRSSGLGRPFNSGHDGRHIRGVDDREGNIITLEPLTGTVVHITLGSSEDPKKLKGNRIIDVQLDKHPYVAIYKDLLDIKARKNQYLRAGTLIGTVLPGSGAVSGFHFTLIRQQFYKRYRQITGSLVALNDKYVDLDIKFGETKDKLIQEKIERQLSEIDKQTNLLIEEYSDSFDKWYIDSVGPQSPVNCPGTGRILENDATQRNPEGTLGDNPVEN